MVVKRSSRSALDGETRFCGKNLVSLRWLVAPQLLQRGRDVGLPFGFAQGKPRATGGHVVHQRLEGISGREQQLHQFGCQRPLAVPEFV